MTVVIQGLVRGFFDQACFELLGATGDILDIGVLFVQTYEKAISYQ